MSVPEPSKSGGQPDNKIRVMLVDDSAVIRGLLSRALGKEDDIEIVSSVSNGQYAVDTIQKADPDIVVLDIEMPVMDGITAIPLLLEKKPGVKILMCSTLSAKGASVSIKALALGATECLVKPTSTSEIHGSENFQSELIRLVRGLSGKHTAISRTTKTSPRKPAAATYALKDEKLSYSGKPSLIAIGSSTGGPQALFSVLQECKDFDVPIVITQHMPKTFTAILAEHIAQNCGLPCHEGADNMPLERGHAYIAPGGKHMIFERREGKAYIRITDDPPENYCKPSIEPMVRSAVKLYGNKVLGVMLTGMGSDGLESFRQLADAGGLIIAQDEETSTVWGMPGAVANAGICSAVMPLQNIGPWIRNQVLKNPAGASHGNAR